MTRSSISISVIAVFVGFMSYQIVAHKPVELPVLGEVPDFKFTDHYGEQFGRDNLKDKVWLLNFFFSSCEMTCPAVNGKLAAIQSEFEDRSGSPALVSITVDPQRDTAETLKSYASRFNADAKRWHFLRGDLEDVKHLAAGVMLEAGGKPDLHSSSIVLVDRAGKIRGFFNGTDSVAIEQLKSALATLLR